MSRGNCTAPVPVMLLSLLLATACGGASSPLGPLDWTLGDWHGVRRAADDGSEAPIALRIEALPEGRGQIERLQVASDGTPYIGFAVRVPVGISGRWMMLYANSARETVSRLEGNIEGNRGTWQPVAPGKKRISRLVSERLGTDRWRRTQHISEDGGKTWRVLFTDELERGEEP